MAFSKSEYILDEGIIESLNVVFSMSFGSLLDMSKQKRALMRDKVKCSCFEVIGQPLFPDTTSKTLT